MVTLECTLDQVKIVPLPLPPFLPMSVPRRYQVHLSSKLRSVSWHSGPCIRGGVDNGSSSSALSILQHLIYAFMRLVKLLPVSE